MQVSKINLINGYLIKIESRIPSFEDFQDSYHNRTVATLKSQCSKNEPSQASSVNSIEYNSSDISFDKDIDYSTLTTSYLKLEFLKPITKTIVKYLKSFGKNADRILLDINNFQLIEKEIIDQKDQKINQIISS
jgi:hypothetical protein